MRYWASAEVEKSVHKSVAATRERLNETITELFLSGSLAELDVEFCYIPIVMSETFIDSYEARTNYDPGEAKFYHSPQLDYWIFKEGREKSQEREYLRGISQAFCELEKLGMSEKQIREFRRLTSIE